MLTAFLLYINYYISYIWIFFYCIFLFIRGNTRPRKKVKYMPRCHYNEETHPYCPVFRLGYIAEQAREEFSELCRTVSTVFTSPYLWLCLLVINQKQSVLTLSMLLGY